LGSLTCCGEVIETDQISGSKQHEEIFSFRRIKEGRHLGKEWGDIVEPVIMRWVWFLKKYFLGEV